MAYTAIPGIYKLTNRSNGMCYIGQSKSIKRRWNCIKQYAKLGLADYPLYQGLSEHGWDGFDKEVLIVVDNQEDLDRYEKLLIETLGCRYPDGYNLKEGGIHGSPAQVSIDKVREKVIGVKRGPRAFKPRGVPLTDDHKEKLRQAMLGKKFPPEFGEKISAAKKANPWVPSEETRKKMAAASAGRKHSEETKQKMREWNLGRTMPPDSKTFSDEYRQAMSVLKKGQASYMKGKTHTPEARAKMSASRKGKPHSEAHKAAIAAARLKNKAEREAQQGAKA